jgi:hypothetical protein
MKIYVRMAGGLGNQLFQVSAAKYLGSKISGSPNEYRLMTSSLTRYETPRVFHESIVAAVLGSDYEAVGSGWADAWMSLRVPRLLSFDTRFLATIGDVDSLKRAVGSRAKHFFLDGYFQDPVVLPSCAEREAIRRRLFARCRDKLMGFPDLKDSVALHLRRGDYLSKAGSGSEFLILNKDFYLDAISIFEASRPILVFSDDNLAADTLARELGGVAAHQYGLSVEEEFVFMVRCHSHVIANSTFSYWAAWLGQSESSEVVGPLNWKPTDGAGQYLMSRFANHHILSN